MTQAVRLHTASYRPVICDAMSTEWSRLKEPHERLKWARQHAGFDTAKAAADSLGMKKDTYSAYEREPGKSKTTGLDHQSAIRFARKFKISWEWLLIGQGMPFARPLTVAQQRALQAMQDAPEAEQARAAEVVETLLKRA